MEKELKRRRLPANFFEGCSHVNWWMRGLLLVDKPGNWGWLYYTRMRSHVVTLHIYRSYSINAKEVELLSRYTKRSARITGKKNKRRSKTSKKRFRTNSSRSLFLFFFQSTSKARCVIIINFSFNFSSPLNLNKQI